MIIVTVVMVTNVTRVGTVLTA